MPFDIPYATLMEQHGFIPADHAAPKFFPVKALNLYDERGTQLPGWKRIVRDDTGDTLHIASDTYKVIENEVAFAAFEDALRASTLDLADMRIGTDYAHGGARCFRQYLLPAHRVEVKPGVEVALRLLMMNSYDGYMKFRGQTGAYNFVCANTSIVGKDYASFALRHVGDNVEFDTAKAIQGLVKAAEDHVTESARWKTWPAIAVTDAQAVAVCKSMPLATATLTDHLVHAWIAARDDGGPQSGANLWTLFNVLTAWSSHNNTEIKGGRGQARFDREKRVATVIEGKVWQELATA